MSGSRISTLFRSCDLDLDPMTFIYEHDPYYLEIYRMWIYELPTLRLSKIRTLLSDIDKQTHDRNYIGLPRRFAGGQQITITHTVH